MLLSGTDTLLSGDFDMQVQMTEAARISIVEFHQFPAWNPWVSGGVPLFADPQFGLVTPQTILSLIVGSIYAWKLTIAFYLVVGFFGMRKLISYLAGEETYPLYTSFISYIFIFGSFFTLRAVGGHFTFLILTLTPLAIYLLLTTTKSRKQLLLLTLLIAYCINAALHYSVILLLLILGFIATVYMVTTTVSALLKKASLRTLRDHLYSSSTPFRHLALAVAGAVVLTSIRIYYSLEYLRDSNTDRTAVYEKFIGFGEGIRSIALPYGSYISNKVMAFSQFEASNYIGTITLIILATLILLLLTTFKRSWNTLSTHSKTLAIIFVLLAGTSFFVGLGGEVFSFVRHLPGMSVTRVSTRYFFITTLSLLIISSIISIAHIKSKTLGKYTNHIITIVLFFALIQVIVPNFQLYRGMWINNPAIFRVSSNMTTHTEPPVAEKLWGTNPMSLTVHYYALTEATVQQKDQIIADNALVDTTAKPSQRCDEDEKDCQFILTHNATVGFWSPNRIIIQRTGPGPIELNINNGAHWRVNHTYPYGKDKVVESNSTFTIVDDHNVEYTLTYSPEPSFLK
jgi:hypothetical protein